MWMNLNKLTNVNSPPSLFSKKTTYSCLNIFISGCWNWYHDENSRLKSKLYNVNIQSTYINIKILFVIKKLYMIIK